MIEKELVPTYLVSLIEALRARLRDEGFIQRHRAREQDFRRQRCLSFGLVMLFTLQKTIKEYHKALKSGAGVQESQLEKAHRLEPLIGVLAVVAVRLLSTKMLARSRPETFEAASSFAGLRC